MKYEFATLPEKCPNCGSKHIAEIQYGTPAEIEPTKYTLFAENKTRLVPELERKIKSGEIILGGCFKFKNQPAWKCNDCKTPIYKIWPPKSK
jgi:hypothetical protein